MNTCVKCGGELNTAFVCIRCGFKNEPFWNDTSTTRDDLVRRVRISDSVTGGQP